MLKYLWDQRDYKNRKWELLQCFIFSRGKLTKLFIEEKKLDREIEKLDREIELTKLFIEEKKLDREIEKLDREIDGMIKFRAHVNGQIAKVKRWMKI
jgi:hypothetical protein